MISCVHVLVLLLDFFKVALQSPAGIHFGTTDAKLDSCSDIHDCLSLYLLDNIMDYSSISSTVHQGSTGFLWMDTAQGGSEQGGEHQWLILPM